MALSAAAFGSSAASAAPRPHPSLLPSQLRVLVGPLADRAFPWATPRAEGESQHMVSLVARPVTVLSHGIAYQMRFAAFSVPDSFGAPPDIEIALSRRAPVPGELAAYQAHDYGFAPDSGVTFTTTPRVRSAVLDTAATLAPGRVDLTYTAHGPTTTSHCFFGTSSRSSGTLTAQHFAIDTGTSPIFGTLTTPPTAATLESDPGCGDLLASRTARYRYTPECSGRTTLTAGDDVLDGSGTLWLSEIGVGGGRLVQFAATASYTHTTYVDHVVAAALHPAGLVTRHGAHGATARVRTTENPFMSGSASFVSHAAPSTSVVQRCIWERHTHRFVGTKYTGTLSSGDAPFTAEFDTGASVLHPQRATLVLRHYLD